jgi:PadR family transcriptional regulator, regulatory protein PadR
MRMTAQTQSVLAALLADPTQARYGLEITKEAGLPSGTIYPILARLESAGWIKSKWEEIDPTVEGRRPRRYYRLTAEGEIAARRNLSATIDRLATAVRPRLGVST